jgi:hypothetical protein
MAPARLRHAGNRGSTALTDFRSGQLRGSGNSHPDRRNTDTNAAQASTSPHRATPTFATSSTTTSATTSEAVRPAPPTAFRLPTPASGTAAAAARTAVIMGKKLGALPEGGSLPARAQRALESQRWSTFFCPLLWAAAGDDITDPVLQRLTEVLRGSRFEAEVDGEQLAGPLAARRAWLALRAAMRQNGIHKQVGLAEWMARQRIGPQQPLAVGRYFDSDAQEYVVNSMAEHNGAVRVLEASMTAAPVPHTSGRDTDAGRCDTCQPGPGIFTNCRSATRSRPLS